jgi:hypothetical protein
MKAELSPSDIADLILQRTGTFIQWGGGGALGRWFETGQKQQLVKFLADSGRLQAFLQAVHGEVLAEFEILRPHIAAVQSQGVTSIGPGLGMFELLVYNLSRPNLLLIDIEQSAEHQHGFGASGSGYNSLATCRRFLVANGAAEEHITTCNPRREALPDFGCDLLVSLLSMGFHYPCDEYAPFIRENLRQGGFLIFDKRLQVPDAGWDQLAPLFDIVAELPSPKLRRLVLRRK